MEGLLYNDIYLIIYKIKWSSYHIKQCNIAYRVRCWYNESDNYLSNKGIMYNYRNSRNISYYNVIYDLNLQTKGRLHKNYKP